MLYESTPPHYHYFHSTQAAGLGALLALLITGNDFSIISAIGVILLMGIVKKTESCWLISRSKLNAHRKLVPVEAMVQACDKRFRPILMTTLAAILGALPLIFSGGNGSELRKLWASPLSAA